MLIAQISDVHASIDNGNLARLDSAVRWLCCVRPDATIVTGDLTDNGWSDGYKEIKVILEKIGSPLSVIPGNSDDPLMMRNLFAETHGWEGSSALHTELNLGGIRAIALDVTVAGEAHGNIERHIEWLENKLNADHGSKTIIFTHQHLFPSGINAIDVSMCRGYEKLEELIVRRETRPIAISSGHVHRPMASVIAGVPSYICGSICPANPLLLDSWRNPPVTDPPSLMIHDLRSGRLVSSHVSIGSCH